MASLAAPAAEVAEFHEAALEQAFLGLRISGGAVAAVDAGLLGNATRHATPGSDVLLRIAQQPGRTEITVENAGRPSRPRTCRACSTASSAPPPRAARRTSTMAWAWPSWP